MKPLSEIEKNHFYAFVKHLSPSKNLAERWGYFVKKNKPNYWAAVDPMKYWEVESTQYKTVELPKLKIQEWVKIKTLPLQKKLIDEVVLVGCGHATPLVNTLDFDEFLALDDLDLPIEYVASLVPGKAAFVTNHDGETMLLYR